MIILTQWAKINLGVYLETSFWCVTKKPWGLLQQMTGCSLCVSDFRPGFQLNVKWMCSCFIAGRLALFTGLGVPCPPKASVRAEGEHREMIVSEECQDRASGSKTPIHCSQSAASLSLELWSGVKISCYHQSSVVLFLLLFFRDSSEILLARF